MISRRQLLRGLLLAGGGATVARSGSAQQGQGAGLVDTSNLFAMDQSAARSVRRPPKPGASPSMTPTERDVLERRIRCQCGCTLDVYTCRTTDFSCQVSPSMHRDVMSLVQGGYTADEIIEAFVSAYGERVLMAPPRVGFNRLAYVLPGSAIAVGALVLAFVIRRWRRTAAVAEAASAPENLASVDATPEEIARLEAAVRREDA